MGFSRAVLACVGVALATPCIAAPVDPYAALQVYAGQWSVSSAKGKALTVRNTCARTGKFFVCEQALDGASKSLVVFLPRSVAGDSATYLTQTLGADGAEPGHWFNLAISGAEWVYSPAGADPKERTLNHVIDPDHIRYEIQTRTGETWRTTSSGVETRVK